jgi:cytochrome P450
LLWRWPLDYLERCRARHGARFTIRVTSRPPLVFLSDPAEIGAMLAAAADVLHPGEGAETVEPLVGGESFMLHEGALHLSGRRLVLPPFRGAALATQAEAIAALTERELAAWPRGVPVAIHPRLRLLTLETILRTIFAPLPAERERLRVVRDHLLAMLEVTASAVLPEPLLRHGPGRRTWKLFLHRRAAVYRLIREMILDRSRVGEPRGGLLDALLDARNENGSPFSPGQVLAHLMSIVLAGHETTASQLAWAFQLLAHNPAVQDRLIEELDAGDGEAYLSATVKEVLRHRPVFLFAIPRAVKRPIEIGGFPYRPPAHLLACIYLVHHDPMLYPDPELFSPERFLDDPRHPAPLWLPWGGGRKRCPGLHLATLEIETVLRTVLATTTIRPAQREIERPRWRSVIVTPHAGSRVILQPRRAAGISATRHL